MELFGDKRTYPGGAGARRILWLGARCSPLFHPGWLGTSCWQNACMEWNRSRVERPMSRMLGIEDVGQTSATTATSDPPASLKGQQLFNMWEAQRSWEGARGNLLCWKYGSHLVHWKLLLRPDKWNLREIKHGDWAKGYGIEMCPPYTLRWHSEPTQLRKLKAGW